MLPRRSFWAGRRVCVTGGTGFLGFHLVKRLLRLGAYTRVFGLAPKTNHPIWSMRTVDIRLGDIRDPEAVRDAIEDRDIIFHMAGGVAVWGPGIRLMDEVHREGTRNILVLAKPQTRIVHTSSVVTVGASEEDRLLDEDSSFDLHNVPIAYVHAKRAAEQMALAAGRDVVVVNPGFLVGPEDYEASVMGRYCVRVWKGRVPVVFPGGFNLVDARDVAVGHLLAAEHGQTGRRYILGGENHTHAEFLSLLHEVARLRPRQVLRLPGWALTGLAHLSELRARWTGKEPYPSLGHARLNQYHWFYHSERARVELGYSARPVYQSLGDALAWHKSQDDVQPRGINAWWMRRAA